MKKMILFFGIALMSLPIFATENGVNNNTTNSMNVYRAFNDSTNESVLFNSIDNYRESVNYMQEDECTVAITATVYGVSVSVSVTAETCGDAGAGAVEALIAAAKKIRDDFQK